MFDLSLIELLFVAVVALVVIGPRDLPKAMKAVFDVLRQLRDATSEIRSQVDSLMQESGIQEAKEEIQTIIDENGQIQRVYDIDEFLDKPKLTEAPSNKEKV